ncbi:hypothetical protein GGD83_002450 [Rhodoblastus sphagnicola]|uniref:radical SAM protein n=1 Tax=Rhodoblastus sphagnicola TaxID=333368 RepID=UPI0013048848|nr:hypothetical protein [Rhodoblastus sphagnicola]MBB4198646.1 hypothetical protein [Rhodoblastus sphagnicola]
MKSPADMKVIQIEITNACPLKCSGCTRLCGHHEEPFFMDFETFKAAVDSLKGFDGIVGVMGGEPTIHPEFPRFMDYYRANVGYDDHTTGSYKPTGDYMRHVLANTWHTDYSNKRGLWSMMPPKYYEHFELIQDTFAYQSLNDHSKPSLHQTQLVTRKELGIPDEEWFKLRDRCWVQNLWSASITPKGAFFCEVAAAMDATLGGPGGWKIEPGWWQRKPEDFGDQLNWCEMCSACLPMPSRDARDQCDDVSPVWAEKLEGIKSPKLRKGLVNVFDPQVWQKDKHSIIQTHMPYMDDQETRMGKVRDRMTPHKITEVLWLTCALKDDAARALIDAMKAAGRLAAIASRDENAAALAEQAGVPFVSGAHALKDLIAATNGKDWALLCKDAAMPVEFLDFAKTCVFNPGVIHGGGPTTLDYQFFNFRALSLRNGGDLFNLASAYPARKVVTLKSWKKKDYVLSDVGMFLRRLLKRWVWFNRKIRGKEAARGSFGAWKGNKVSV